MILGHIGVRKGSKGVVRKNFKPICGKPLIDWSLEQLLEHPQVDTVVVSTDDEEIYAHAIARGTLAIGLRPDHLATDSAGKWGVWQHALMASEALIGNVDAFLDLDATSPLRLPADITNALALYQSEQPDMVMSCCEARKNPYFNLVEQDENGIVQLSKPLKDAVTRRQDSPKCFDMNASNGTSQSPFFFLPWKKPTFSS